MSVILHVDARAEPREFHPEAKGECYAISLAIQVTEGTEDDAKPMVEGFLDALARGRLYLVADDGSAQVELEHLFDPGAPPPDLKSWLERAKAAYAKLAPDTIPDGGVAPASGVAIEPRFYVSPDRNEGVTGANMRNATAFDLLRTAARWPAPVAQNAGLLTSVSVAGAPVAGVKRAVVFLPDGADLTAVNYQDQVGERLRLQIPWLGGATIETRSEILEPFDPTKLGERFRADGVYQLLPGAQDLAARLGRIGEEGPSQLWAATALLGLGADPEAIFGMEGAPPDPAATYPAEIYNWVVRAAAISVFDIVIGGALRTYSNDGDHVTRRSRVLERLSARLVAAFEADDFTLDVDDAALYLALHKNVWARFAGLRLEELAATIPDGEVKKALTESPAQEPLTREDWRQKFVAFSAALSDLARLLENEAGAESWLLARLSEALRPSEESTGRVLHQEIEATLPEPAPGDEQKFRDKVAAAYRAFEAEIRGEFDAAEALRGDWGAEIVSALLSATSFAPDAAGSSRADQIAAALVDADGFVRRFEANPAEKALDVLFKPLLRGGGVAPEVAAELSEQLESKLSERWTARARYLADDPQAGPFRPDKSPQPLFMPFVEPGAGGPDATEAVTSFTSGLAYLIRAGNRPAVHASLVEVKFDREKPILTVDPAQPAFSDGAAGVFIRYNGTPLSTPNLVAPALTAAPASDDIRPYTIDDATHADEKTRVPALAYGVKYGASAFWLPPSGVLPPKLRAGGPFDPVAEVGAKPFAVPDEAMIPYLRRTGISDMALETGEAGGRDGATAIGELLQGVHPLAIDAPRIALAEGGRWRDLWRRTDGTGSLASGEVVLRDFRRSSEFDLAGALEIRIMRNSGERGAEVDSPNPSEDGTLTLTLPDGLHSAWLRLRLKDDGGADPMRRAVSFADPSAESGSVAVDPSAGRGSSADREPAGGRAAPVLLLAPHTPDAAPKRPPPGWSVPAERELQVALPRVSFEDFSRWARNDSLWIATCGGDKELAEKIFRALRQAHAVLNAVGDPMQEAVNQLPDPAVSALWLEVAVADRTLRDIGEGSVAHLVVVAPYADTTLNPPDLAKVDRTKVISEAKKFLRLLTVASRMRLSVRSGESLGVDPDARILTVPVGGVTKLHLCPGVPARFIAGDAVFDRRMDELSVGRLEAAEELVLFGGPDLSIEAMRPIRPALDAAVLERPLAMKTAGTARAYALTASLSPQPQGRLFASAVLTNQRWRPTGVPIDTWISPAPPGAARPIGPVVEVAPDLSGLDGFEGDAFATRTKSDAERIRVRLDPAANATRVFEFAWPERSATYLRHRVELISRYAGAMHGGLTSLETAEPSPDPARKDAWAIRVAILADPLRAPVTRPQLRAYLPLLRRADDAGPDTPAPPMACILSEPPYAQLGLADRVEADIRTTHLYSFEDIGEERKRLRLDDLRKEVGPDPLLSYHSVSQKRSRSAVLRAEGPVGLHFDSPETASPAWSNSQYLLHLSLDPAEAGDPVSLGELEESFLAVALSRHADPGWCHVPESAHLRVGGALAPDADYWILPAPGAMVKLQSGEDETLVEFDRRSDRALIRVVREALFPKSGEAMTPLWEGDLAAALLKATGGGRYRLSLYDTTPENGASRLVASVAFEGKGALRLDGDAKVVPTRQSDETMVRWVKTARDLSRLGLAENESPAEVLIEALTATAIAGSQIALADREGRPRSVAPPVALRPGARYLHRRLAFVLREPTLQPGHVLSVAKEVLLADGCGRALTKAVAGTTELTLAEIEVPARPVAFGGPERPKTDEFRSAHFDLKSTGGTKLMSLARFHIRAAEGGVDPQTLKAAIAWKTTAEEADEQRVTVSLGELGIDVPRLSSFDLILSHSPDRTACHVAWNNSDGTRTLTKMPTDWPPDMLVSALSFDVELLDHGREERWADISLLHSAQEAFFSEAEPDRFDFDWMFGGSIEALPEALRPETLNRLAEVQATIRGLSDPIPFRNP